jgi:hypothetical protein
VPSRHTKYKGQKIARLAKRLAGDFDSRPQRNMAAMMPDFLQEEPSRPP